ncbi:uncharacterized protein [Eurosta solidaginis]|uniref:uncharacterized protein n=1 Tax=Eurosta solidaginis TaxID=178769 RepID=UPI0035310ECF
MASRKAQHILKLSPKEQKDFIKSFDVVICDCDGVIWLIMAPIPNTAEAVNVLKADGKRVIFVSNNSLRTDEDYFKKFTNIGVKNFEKDHIIHPAKSMVQYIKKHNIKPTVFSLCSDQLNKTMRKGGIEIITLDTKEHLDLAALANITTPKQKVGAVICDINVNLNYAQICAGIRYLEDKDCVLLAGGSDWILPLTPDLNIPGFVYILKTITKFAHKEALIVAKPSTILSDIVKEVYDLKDPKRCLFVGDSLTHDIRFGLDSGFQTLLVLTGSTQIEELMGASEEQQPDYYADGLADFIKLYGNLAKA